MSKSKNRTRATDLGALLRQWRGARNKSQMEASLDAGVSQRHLSFIEIGRSVPSRETLIGIAEALEIPYRDRNSLLLAHLARGFRARHYRPRASASGHRHPHRSVRSAAEKNPRDCSHHRSLKHEDYVPNAEDEAIHQQALRGEITSEEAIAILRERALQRERTSQKHNRVLNCL